MIDIHVCLKIAHSCYCHFMGFGMDVFYYFPRAQSNGFQLRYIMAGDSLKLNKKRDQHRRIIDNDGSGWTAACSLNVQFLLIEIGKLRLVRTWLGDDESVSWHEIILHKKWPGASVDYIKVASVISSLGTIWHQFIGHVPSWKKNNDFVITCTPIYVSRDTRLTLIAHRNGVCCSATRRGRCMRIPLMYGQDPRTSGGKGTKCTEIHRISSRTKTQMIRVSPLIWHTTEACCNDCYCFVCPGETWNEKEKRTIYEKWNFISILDTCVNTKWQTHENLTLWCFIYLFLFIYSCAK